MNIVAVCLLLTANVHAQHHSFTAGVLGGTSLWKTDSQLKDKLEFAAGIDVSYAIRWNTGRVEIGPKMGVCMVFAQSGLIKNDYNDRFTNTDYLGQKMDYDIHVGSIVEHNKHVQVEVPLMLSFAAGGWVFNAGAKVMMPIYRERKATLKDATITAFYPAYEVPITNKIATGMVDQSQLQQSAKGLIPSLNVLLSGEISYEWDLSINQKVGLQLFVDYDVWNNFNPAAVEGREPTSHIIEVAAITRPDNPIPTVRVNSLAMGTVTRMNYLAFGLKMYLVFDRHNTRARRYNNACHCVGRWW